MQALFIMSLREEIGESRSMTLSGSYTLKEIGEHYGKHYTTISRIVKKIEIQSGKT